MRLIRAEPLLVAALLALPHPAEAGPRASVGGGVALDPAFAAGAVALDWFFTPTWATGALWQQTVPRTGDRDALESGYGFVNVVGRGRTRVSGPWNVEGHAGAGAARVRYGAPGSHTEWAPDLVLGAGLDLNVARAVAVGLEAATHITFGERTGTRNQPHVSTVLTLILRAGR
jgi:hypothetical protein